MAIIVTAPGCRYACGMTGPSSATRTAADDLGRALGTLLRAYLDGARSSAIEQIPGGLRGYQVLAIAGDGSCRNQASIAESLGLDRTVMTYLVDDLERAGLVGRRPDPADRRSRQVVLTDAGRAAHETARASLARVERHVLGALDETEAEQLRRLLGRATSGLPLTADVSACTADDTGSC